MQPTITQFPLSVGGAPGGDEPPLKPKLITVPTGVPSLRWISKTCSRNAILDVGYGTAVLISFVGYSGSAGGHTVAVANIGGSLLFFDPNLGERQFKTLDGKGIVDAIAACWVTGFTSDTGLLLASRR